MIANATLICSRAAGERAAWPASPGRRASAAHRATGSRGDTEPPDTIAVSRRDPPTRDLPSLGVRPLRSDLRLVLIKTHHDHHQTASLVRQFARTYAARGRKQAYRPARTVPLHMPSIKSRRRSSVGDRRYSRTRSDPRVDSDKES